MARIESQVCMHALGHTNQMLCFWSGGYTKSSAGARLIIHDYYYADKAKF